MKWNQEQFARAVRVALAERNWRVCDLAEATAISASNLSDIMNGKIEPGIGKVQAIARVLKTTVSALLAEDSVGESHEDARGVQRRARRVPA